MRWINPSDFVTSSEENAVKFGGKPETDFLHNRSLKCMNNFEADCIVMNENRNLFIS